MEDDIICDSGIIANITIKRRRINEKEPEEKAELIRNGNRVRKPKKKARISKKKEL